MSISAFVQDPRNDVETRFSIPIATEEFFRRVWVPACEELDLKWVTLFPIGVEVTEDNVGDVRSELTRLKEWVSGNLPQAEAEHVQTRSNLLLDGLQTVFTRADISVFIG